MDNPNQKYRVLRLVVASYGGVKVADITPARHAQKIAGENGAGKSSILNALVALIGGAKQSLEKPVYDGDDGAVIVGVLGDKKPELLVKRCISPDGKHSLTIQTPEGFEAPSPQGILNQFYSLIGFDPLAFVRKDAKSQVEMLRQLVGIDFAEIDSKRESLYLQRTRFNEQHDTAQTSAKAIVIPDDTPEEEISVKALMDEQQARESQNRLNASERQKVNALTMDLTNRQMEVKALDEKIADLEVALQKARTGRVSADSRVFESQAALDGHKAHVATLIDMDVREVTQKIIDSQAINANVNRRKEKSRLEEAAKSHKAKSEELTLQLKAIDQEKADLTSNAKWPMNGLGFGKHGVEFSGIPLKQVNMEKQLRISLRIGAALDPRLQVAIVREASVIDRKHREVIEDECRELDLQCFMEIANSSEPAQVVIEEGDGTIVMQNGAVVIGGTPVDTPSPIKEKAKRSKKAEKPKLDFLEEPEDDQF